MRIWQLQSGVVEQYAQSCLCHIRCVIRHQDVEGDLPLSYIHYLLISDGGAGRSLLLGVRSSETSLVVRQRTRLSLQRRRTAHTTLPVLTPLKGGRLWSTEVPHLVQCLNAQTTLPASSNATITAMVYDSLGAVTSSRVSDLLVAGHGAPSSEDLLVQ